MFVGLAALIDDRGPLVFLVDDLHCADTASIAVLDALGCAEHAALAVVATVHPDPERDPDRRLQHTPAIALGPLAADDLARLGLLDALVETGGHPATVLACIAAKRTDGHLQPEALTAVVERVAEAGEPASRLLRMAAALEQPFTATDLAFTAAPRDRHGGRHVGVHEASRPHRLRRRPLSVHRRSDPARPDRSRLCISTTTDSWANSPRVTVCFGCSAAQEAAAMIDPRPFGSSPQPRSSLARPPEINRRSTHRQPSIVTDVLTHFSQLGGV